MHKKSILFLIYICLCFMGMGAAVPRVSALPPQRGFPVYIDSFHGHLSTLVRETAIQMDNFFLNDRFLAEDNHSRIIVQPGFGWKEGEGFDNFSKFYVRLKLPRIQKRYNLLFSSTTDEDSQVEKTPLDPPDELPGNRDEDRLNAAIQYQLRDTLKRNFRFQAGFRLSSDPQIYAGARFRYYKTIGNHGIRFIQNSRYFSLDKWDLKASLDVDHEYSDHYLFRFTLDGAWYEKGKEGYPHGQSLSLLYTPTSNRGIQFQISQFLHTKPAYETTDITLQVRYRQRLWRPWFLFEIAPQLSFPRERDFKNTPGLVIKCEILLGSQKNKKNLF